MLVDRLSLPTLELSCRPLKKWRSGSHNRVEIIDVGQLHDQPWKQSSGVHHFIFFNKSLSFSALESIFYPSYPIWLNSSTGNKGISLGLWMERSCAYLWGQQVWEWSYTVSDYCHAGGGHTCDLSKLHSSVGN